MKSRMNKFTQLDALLSENEEETSGLIVRLTIEGLMQEATRIQDRLGTNDKQLAEALSQVADWFDPTPLVLREDPRHVSN